MKKAINMLAGLKLSWSVVDPLAADVPGEKNDLLKPTVEHSNPVYRMMLPEILSEYRAMIEYKPLKWRVVVRCEFCDTNGQVYFETAEIVIYAVLSDADEYYQDELESIFFSANMDEYRTTHLSCTILGAGAIREKDFENKSELCRV